MSLTVLDPGLLSLVVDLGRPGWRSLGVPLGGAADRAALALGNALVGNPPASPALEVTLAGPTLRAGCPVAGVVFGAPFAASVNGRPLAPGVTFSLEAGDLLKVGGTPSGARGYLCVAGGFDVPEVMGGRSALGPVAAGEVLACRGSRGGGRGLGFGESATVGRQANRDELRVLDGPQRDWFPDGVFFDTAYEVSPASDRMGVRFRGEPLARRAGELVSEAVAPGAVQVANDGRPIVLGVDGQTIGGYPKVAHVVRADLDALAQLRPGDRVRFRRVTVEEAETAARERTAAVRLWLARLAAAEGGPAFLA